MLSNLQKQLHIYLIVFNIRRAIFFERLAYKITALLDPPGPVDLYDLHRVMKKIEQAFTKRRLAVTVSAVYCSRIDATYILEHAADIDQYDINDTIPDIVELLQSEQWQVRPVSHPNAKGKHCLAVTY